MESKTTCYVIDKIWRIFMTAAVISLVIGAIDEMYSERMVTLKGNIIRAAYNAQCHGQLPIIVGDGHTTYECKEIK